jgi:hypothetical protein
VSSSIYVGNATLIRRGGLTTGVISSMFSFSSCSLAPDVPESRPLTSVLFRRDSSEDAVRRCGFAAGVTDEARAKDEGTRLGVADGVARDERLLIEGVIEDSSLLAATFTTEPLGRMGREGLAVTGSLLVLLASDMADEGRTTLGVAKIDDSRRNVALAAGVCPTDVLVPIFRLS